MQNGDNVDIDLLEQAALADMRWSSTVAGHFLVSDRVYLVAAIPAQLIPGLHKLHREESNIVEPETVICHYKIHPGLWFLSSLT